MGRNRSAIMISAILGIVIITVAAVATGHNSTLVTGATASLVGIATGAGFYYKGKSDQAKTAAVTPAPAAGCPGPRDAAGGADGDGNRPSTT